MSVKDKLNQLNLIEKTRNSYRGLSKFEENLKTLIERSVVDLELVLNYIIAHSR